MSFEDDVNDSDVLRILVATDIHLGFEERDPIRGHDSFDTFEEILQTAVSEDVDFILLGGDLFHHAKPTPYSIHKCTELLRRYCLGDKPVEVEFLTDPNTSISTSMVNYEDPNLNVSIPVFSIHGNHDDPTGQEQISAIDLLATSGLMNYFGKAKSYDEIEVQPLCFKKGDTTLALYGLSYVKDERLARLFLDNKVTFKYPGSVDDWFHLLVWHQNRVPRGIKSYIPEDSLPEHLNLVIWGHEHDCRIMPEQRNKVFVSQPGSSIATSLSEGEATAKQIAVLRIYQKHFKIHPIELKTVRPFIYRDKFLENTKGTANTKNAPSPSELSMEAVKNEIDEMIAEAQQLGRTPRVSEKPLIRLNVRCQSEKQVFNSIRFGQTYIEKVANPENMVKCQVIKAKQQRRKNDINVDDDSFVNANRVEDYVASAFTETDPLELYPFSIINEAVKKFIDTNDNDAVSDVVEHYKKLIMTKLEEDMPDTKDVNEIVSKYKLEHEKESLEDVGRFLNDPARHNRVRAKQEKDPSHPISDENELMDTGANEDEIIDDGSP